MRRRSLRHDVGGAACPGTSAGRTRSSPPSALTRRDVGDERAIEARGQLRREVARLVGVRQQHERRRQLPRSPAAAPPCSRPACSGSSAACSTVTTSFTCAAASSPPTAAMPAPGTSTAIGARSAAPAAARRRSVSQRRAVQLAAALFARIDQDHCTITRASSRRPAHQLLRGFRRRPPISCVFFAFSARTG